MGARRGPNPALKQVVDFTANRFAVIGKDPALSQDDNFVSHDQPSALSTQHSACKDRRKRRNCQQLLQALRSFAFSSGVRLNAPAPLRIAEAFKIA